MARIQYSMYCTVYACSAVVLFDAVFKAVRYVEHMRILLCAQYNSMHSTAHLVRLHANSDAQEGPPIAQPEDTILLFDIGSPPGRCTVSSSTTTSRCVLYSSVHLSPLPLPL